MPVPAGEHEGYSRGMDRKDRGLGAAGVAGAGLAEAGQAEARQAEAGQVEARQVEAMQAEARQAEARQAELELRMYEKIKELYNLDFETERRRIEARLEFVRESRRMKRVI